MGTHTHTHILGPLLIKNHKTVLIQTHQWIPLWMDAWHHLIQPCYLPRGCTHGHCSIVFIHNCKHEYQFLYHASTSFLEVSDCSLCATGNNFSKKKIKLFLKYFNFFTFFLQLLHKALYIEYLSFTLTHETAREVATHWEQWEGLVRCLAQGHGHFQKTRE